MKGYKEVEAARREYHKDPNLNSVHRSSLMVPEMEGTTVGISFLNHFLIKRNYPKVACRITPIDLQGKKLESRLYMIEKPKVYMIKLSGMVQNPVSNYLVEFYAAENLFIPFPAVMINHHGNGFINQVHSYNRVLNDVFEDEAINSTQVNEASIDFILRDKIDTFLLFSSGPLPCDEPLEVQIMTNNGSIVKQVETHLPRLCNRKISLRQTFPDIPNDTKGVLKVKQPKQFLFFGRMLAGQASSDGAFSGNHSYYDSSNIREYWDKGNFSQRFYPFFNDLVNAVTMYPIMSPSELSVFISLYKDDGSLIKDISVGLLSSPGNSFVEASINSLAQNAKIEIKEISTFALSAKAEPGKLPTRINHQLIYGCGGLNSSINISLFNSNIFIPEDKKSFSWAQTVVGGDYDTFVGIVADSSANPKVKSHEVKTAFYGENGLVSERNWKIPNGSAIKFAIGKELESELTSSDMKQPKSIWCTVESEQYGVTLYTVTRNNMTMHCSGEHAF
ncbi:MAG: hypothetical protein ACRD9Q_03530 [Nitrososphaeraceae archaeon]